MRRTAVLSFGVLVLVLLEGTQLACFAQKGKTIFGENRKATQKEMVKVAKSLGVKCVFCHVKEGGKMNYEEETKHKIIGRSMKLSMVDSLAIKDTVTVEIPEHESKIKILAVLQANGADAGIHLTATTPDNKVHKKTLPLPKEGESITCMTCHQRQLHFLTHDHDEETK